MKDTQIKVLQVPGANNQICAYKEVGLGFIPMLIMFCILKGQRIEAIAKFSSERERDLFFDKLGVGNNEHCAYYAAMETMYRDAKTRGTLALDDSKKIIS